VAWRSFWRFLQDMQKLSEVQHDPEELKRPNLSKYLPSVISLLGVAKLLDMVYCDDSPVRGLRLSKMLGLTFDQIEYRDGQPLAVRVVGKGDKERRVLLSPTAQTALLRWLRERRMHGRLVSAWVWPPHSGKRYGEQMQARTIEEMMDAAAKKAGLDVSKVSPHKLRHAFATALVEGGRSLDEVRDLLGHESIATTQIYAHTSQKRIQDATASLPDVVGLSER